MSLCINSNIKKAIIFTVSTGGGHDEAANSIADDLRNLGIEAIVKDPYTLKGQKAKERVANAYTSVVRYIPHLFGAIYKLGDWYSRSFLPSPIYQICSKHAKRVAKYLEEEKPDIVICTHLYAMEMMTAIFKKKLYSVKCYGVLTDYTIHPFIRDSKLDGYIIGHENVKQDFIKNRIPEEKLICGGIPIDKKFKVRMDRDEACRALGLDSNKRVILIMSGSIGCSAVYRMTKRIARKFKNAQIVVLTGHNKFLYYQLNDLLFLKNVIPVEFINNVETYLSAADVVLSKAGGLSTTEIINYNVPLIHVHSIPGIESANARFFAKLGCSKVAKTNKKAAQLSELLLENSDERNKMLEQQKKVFANNVSYLDKILNV